VGPPWEISKRSFNSHNPAALPTAREMTILPSKLSLDSVGIDAIDLAYSRLYSGRGGETPSG